MRGTWYGLAVALLVGSVAGGAGCATLARAVSYERGGTFEMPDLRGSSLSEAKDKLAAAGITGSVEVVDNYVCHEDEARVGVDAVCSTSPAAGQGRTARTPTTLYLRPRPSAAPMPDVIGRSVGEAKRTLGAAGFARTEVEVLEPGRIPDDCRPQTVCVTSPPAGAPTSFGGTKYLRVPPDDYRPRAAANPSPDDDDVELEGGKPVGTKPAETKPAETKPAETRPADPIF
jgi:beta-lactam-binding protein with PASTA domain